MARLPRLTLPELPQSLMICGRDDVESALLTHSNAHWRITPLAGARELILAFYAYERSTAHLLLPDDRLSPGRLS